MPHRAIPLIIEAFDKLNDSIIILDRDWNYIYANKEALKRLNRTLEEIRDKRVWQLFPYLLGTAFEMVARKSMEDRQPREIEDYYENSGVWYRTKLVPIESGLMLQIEDVTALRKTQKTAETLMSIMDQTLDNGPDRTPLR